MRKHKYNFTWPRALIELLIVAAGVLLALVGAEAVCELHRVMAARHAAGGFIFTSGSFSPEARELARERQIELIDGEQLAPLLAGRRA